MLRESVGNETLTVGEQEDASKYDIPLAAELLAYTDAVCRGDGRHIERARDGLLAASNEATVIDTAGIIADFQGLTRIVDATGTELDERFRLS